MKTRALPWKGSNDMLWQWVQNWKKCVTKDIQFSLKSTFSTDSSWEILHRHPLLLFGIWDKQWLEGKAEKVLGTFQVLAFCCEPPLENHQLVQNGITGAHKIIVVICWATQHSAEHHLDVYCLKFCAHSHMWILIVSCVECCVDVFKSMNMSQQYHILVNMTLTKRKHGDLRRAL